MKYLFRFLVGVFFFLGTYAYAENVFYRVSVSPQGIHLIEGWEIGGSTLNHAIIKYQLVSGNWDVSSVEEGHTHSVSVRGTGYYITYRYVTNPEYLRDGGRSFGHIEVRKNEDGEVVDRWPMFYQVDFVSLDQREFLLKAYLPKNEVMYILKSFVNGSFHILSMILEEYYEPNEKKEGLKLVRSVLSHKYSKP